MYPNRLDYFAIDVRYTRLNKFIKPKAWICSFWVDGWGSFGFFLFGISISIYY